MRAERKREGTKPVAGAPWTTVLMEKPRESRLFILQQSALILTLHATHTDTQSNSQLPNIRFPLPTYENVDLFTNCHCAGQDARFRKDPKQVRPRAENAQSAREGKVPGDLRSRSEGAMARMWRLSGPPRA